MSLRAASKSVRKPQPHHRPSRRARDRILAAADGWAFGDRDVASHGTGCEVVERFIDAAFGTDDGIPYTVARALLETLVEQPLPKGVLQELVMIADNELEGIDEHRAQEAKYAAIAVAVGCSIDEAERIYKSHRARAQEHAGGKLLADLKATLGVAS